MTSTKARKFLPEPYLAFSWHAGNGFQAISNSNSPSESLQINVQLNNALSYEHSMLQQHSDFFKDLELYIYSEMDWKKSDISNVQSLCRRLMSGDTDVRSSDAFGVWERSDIKTFLLVASTKVGGVKSELEACFKSMMLQREKSSERVFGNDEFSRQLRSLFAQIADEVVLALQQHEGRLRDLVQRAGHIELGPNEVALFQKECARLSEATIHFQSSIGHLNTTLQEHAGKPGRRAEGISGFDKLNLWEQMDHLEQLASIDADTARSGLNRLLAKNAGKLSFEEYEDYLRFARRIRAVTRATRSYLQHGNIKCTLSAAEAKNTHGNFRAKSASSHLVASSVLPLFSVKVIEES